MQLKACLILLLTTAVAQEVTSSGSFEELAASEGFSHDVSSEDILVRKRDTEDEIAFAAVDASGELSIARRGDLGSDDMEMKAAAKIDAPKEKPKAVVEKLEATKKQEATKDIAFAAIDASGKLSMSRRLDLGSVAMEMEAAAETDAPKPKAVVEKPEATKKQPETMAEASLEQQGACADISGTYTEELNGRESTEKVITGSSCAFKLGGEVDIAVSGDTAVLMGTRREFHAVIAGDTISFKNGIVWSKKLKGPTVVGPY